MEFFVYFKAIFALVFVLGLISGAAYLAKRFLFERDFIKNKNKDRYLTVEDALFLDAKRRIVLIRRGDKCHLLLLGANSDAVIESGIDVKEIRGGK